MRKFWIIYCFFWAGSLLVSPGGWSQPKANNFDFQILTHVEKDVYVEGAIGILVTHEYNFQPLVEKHLKDSVCKGSVFRIATDFFNQMGTVKCQPEYAKALGNKKNELHREQLILGSHLVKEQQDRFQRFFPYGSMNLLLGENQIKVTTRLTGKDGFGMTVDSLYRDTIISFMKPATKNFRLVADTIRINTRMQNGTKWDAWNFIIPDSEFPDPYLIVTIGGEFIWQKQTSNTFSIPWKAIRPLHLNFTISEGDEVVLLLYDFDLTSHSEFIAKWIFKTTGLPAGKVIEVKDKMKNLKLYKMRYSVSDMGMEFGEIKVIKIKKAYILVNLCESM